ncbi:MAG: acyl--CoA ligase [Nitrospirae bacterium]|nr:acyl--CoA ligase [Nitrospirota bacterium]
MNIFQTIKKETEHFANKTAVIEDDRRVTYGQLIASAELIASSLKAEGVLQSHRVGLLCGDSIDYITASLAVLSLSAVVVPISTDHRVNEINEILESIAVDFLLFEKGTYTDNEAAGLSSKGFPGKNFFIIKRTVKEKPCDEYYGINPAFIRFSSGTTGASKGVVLSHESIIERTDAADMGLRITPADTVLWVLSMSFHFVVTILLFLRRASTIVLCGDRFPESLIEGVTNHKGTFIYASPFHYNLLANSNLLSPDSLKNIRMAVSTAMKLPESVTGEFFTKFGIKLTEAYGIIEVGLPFINLSEDKDKRNSVGKVLPDYEILIYNKDESGVGEIHIRGKGMLNAYFSPWQNRENILKDGWFNTGDLGRIDKDGFLTIAGRGKDVINFVGMKVFPYEVETVINHFPGVKESLVYGEDHPRYGQLPMAKIVPEKDADIPLDELKKFCYRKLSQYKVPKDFEIVDEIPKTASGKIKR